MRPRKVLILYKKSTYEYFSKSAAALLRREGSRQDLERFRQTHDRHYGTLASIETALKDRGLLFHKVARGRSVDYTPYDLVITVGGDGTFLEAAKNLRRQFILGVNSDPQWSVGRFCQTAGEGFSRALDQILAGQFTVKAVHRLQLTLERQPKVPVLNDILIAHRNPAAMSHYDLNINGIMEEQRSSGIWIATAAGSSGAIKSAGGRTLPYESESVQYRPRELHQRLRQRVRLPGGVISLKRPMIVRSLMMEGFIYVDGAHLRFAFPFGSRARISRSPYPLKVIVLKGKRIKRR